MPKLSTYSGKTTPVDADKMPLVDSEDSSNTKLLTIANLKVLIKTLLGWTAASSGNPTSQQFFEQTTNGTNKVTLTAPASLAADVTLTLPDTTATLGYLNIPQNSQSAAYTTVMADAGKEIYHPSSDANTRTFTIDSNANVAYPIGTCIMFTNDSANAVTIAITSDTLVLEGAGTTGSRTLAQYGSAVAKKKTSTRWYISGTNLT